ncbi:hypothetical protein DFJ74DRAFT_640741 [Hyaloraphidium curvatum]|nr:hypothetical protein DFJ74DRAFT_640741 [Hyaloraphidium curvatum]
MSRAPGTSSKVRRRPASAVDAHRQLQFVVAPPRDEPVPRPPLAPERPPTPPQAPLPAQGSSNGPPPGVLGAPGGQTGQGMDLDEFEDGDLDFLAAPESLMMLEQEERKYSMSQMVNNGPPRTVDALQQEFDELPDIALDDPALDSMVESQLNGVTKPAAESSTVKHPVAAPGGADAAVQQRLAQLQTERDALQTEKSALEGQLSSKEGEVTTFRRKYGRLEEDLSRLRAELAEKELAIQQVRNEERERFSKEIEKLNTELRYKDLEIMQQENRNKRNSFAASQVPMSLDANQAAGPSSQVWRATPSKRNPAFARPAPVFPKPSPSPPRGKRAPAPNFDVSNVPRQQVERKSVAIMTEPVVGSVAAVSPLEPSAPEISADRLRHQRQIRDERLGDARRSQFVRSLFSDPTIVPQAGSATNGVAARPSWTPAPSFFSTSLVLQAHSGIKLTKELLSQFEAARLSLSTELTRIVADKTAPLAGVLPHLDSFLDSAIALGASTLVLFAVRLVKLLLTADEDCRGAVLAGRSTENTTDSAKHQAPRAAAGQMPMEVDGDPPDVLAPPLSGSRTLRLILRLLKHVAFASSPGASAASFAWLTEQSTKDLWDELYVVLQTLAWKHRESHAAAFVPIFSAGLHRHMCLRRQHPESVAKFVQLCELFVRVPEILSVFLSPTNGSVIAQRADDDDHRTPWLEMGFLDQLSNFLVEEFPPSPPPNYRLDSLRLRFAVIKLYAAIAGSEFPSGMGALVDSARIVFSVVRSLSLEIQDCIDERSPDRDLSARFVIETAELLHFFTVRAGDAFKRTLIYPYRQAHDLLVLCAGRLANGTLLDVLPEAAAIEDAARDMLVSVASEDEEEEVHAIWGRTKERQLANEAEG